jgi:hypothetical protein
MYRVFVFVLTQKSKMKKKLFKIKGQTGNSTKELRVFEDKKTMQNLFLINARHLNLNEDFKQHFTAPQSKIK